MKFRQGSGLSAVLFLFVLTIALPARAAVYSGYSEFYIPGSEEQLCAILDDLATTQATGIDPAQGMHSVVSITSAGDDTTIYYDHWENGYGFDQNDPDNTFDEKYVLSAGEVESLISSAVPCTTPTGTIPTPYDYDGGDRLYVAGTSVTVSRTAWPESEGPILAISWELLPIKPFLTDYTLPVGVNLASPAPEAYDDFALTYVLVQSVVDNNTVQIDDPTTPGIDLITTLNRGETTQLYNAGAGTRVSGQQPVQVHFIVGGNDGGYEARGYNAIPDSMWDNIYFNPVGSQVGSGTTLAPQAEVDLYLYNPHTSPIIIEWADTSDTGTFTIPALSTISFYDGSGQNGGTSHYVPVGSGTFLTSDDIFWGIGSSDSESTTYDWGYSLIPRDALVEEYFLSWAPGTSDTPPLANGSPAYVTAVFDDTTVFVDYSPTDGIIDATYVIDQLESLKIFDGIEPPATPDYDNTGMHIWATGPLAAAWGEDADAANAGNPYLDLGTANLPMQADWIDLVLTLDKSADPSVLPAIIGSETTFTLVTRTYDFPARGVAVMDILPVGFSYKPDSTVITLPDGNQITGSGANPSIAGQELSWDNTVFNGLNMDANETLTVVFDSVTVWPYDVGTYSNTAQASATRLGGSQIFTPFESAVIYATAMTIDKDTTVPNINAGGTTNFTIKVTNISQADATGIVVNDSLPSPANPTYFDYNSTDAVVTLYDASGNQIGTPTTLPNTGSWDLGASGLSLQAGQYVIISFDVDASSDIPPGTYQSDAETSFTLNGTIYTIDDKGVVGQDPGTPQGEDPQPDENVTVTSLLLNKTTTTPTTQPGGQATYRIEIENAGDGTIDGVEITDVLPGGFTFNSVTSQTYTGTTPLGPPATVPAAPDNSLLWDGWDIGPGGSIIIEFTVDVPLTTPPLTYDNTLFVNSVQTGLIDDSGTVGHWQDDDPATGIIADQHTKDTDTSTDEDVTVQQAVLQIDMDSITKYAVADGTNNGSATYQIKVLNAATGTATAPQVTSTLPTADFSYDAGSPATITLYNSNGTVNSTTTDTNDGTWTVPDIGPGQWVIVTFDTVVAATTPVGTYDSDAGANSNETAAIDDDGTVAYDADTIPLEDPETDEDVIIVNSPRADLAITKSHATDFDPAVTNTYSIEVTNNGPSGDAGIITVTDTLPTGITYASHSGPWTLVTSLPNQTLDFQYTGGTLAKDSSATLTLDVSVDAGTVGNPSTNQVSVVSPTTDPDATNNSAQDVTYVDIPNLTNSSKLVIDINVGDPEPGDIIRYVVRIKEVSGYAANNLTVTDTIDGDYDRTSFNLTTNPGDPLGTGGSSYNPSTGELIITGIDLPPSSSTDIVFEVTIPTDAIQDTVLSNSAIITNPSGNDQTVIAPDLIVQLPVPTTGEKPLYLYENLDLSRVIPVNAQNEVFLPNPANGNSGTPPITVDWELTPQTSKELRIDSSSGTIPVDLWLARTGATNTYRHFYVQLSTTDNNNVETIIGTMQVLYDGQGTNPPTLDFEVPRLETFDLPIDAAWPSGSPGDEIILPAGSVLTLKLGSIEVNGFSAVDRDIYVYPDGTGIPAHSQVRPYVNTVINVDGVSFYDGAYPAGTLITQVSPGATVWIRGEVSDPFGSDDITGATVDITDSEGALRVDDGVMTEVAVTATETKIYEYEYTIPASGPLDFWAASVTAEEGTEGTITDSDAGNIFVFPFTGADLGIVKSHTGDFYRNSNGQFILNVRNAGPEIQTADVIVRDTIPSGLSYLTSSGTGWTVDTSSNPDIVWTYPAPVAVGTALPPITLTVTIASDAPAAIPNTAEVDPGVDENNPGNNSSTDTVYPSDPLVTKVVDVSSPYYNNDSGSNIFTYTITVTNPDPPDSQTIMEGVTVSDQVPAGTSFVNSTVSGPKQVFRITEYFIPVGEFTTTSYDLPLDHVLADNYFVIVQGSDGDGTDSNSRGPDENYIALTGDPSGTGVLTSLGSNNLRFTRGQFFNAPPNYGWVGVITVVESLHNNDTDGFTLVDVARVAHPQNGTTGTANFSSNWTDSSRIMLLGGFNGAGCDTTAAGFTEHNSCQPRIEPTGTNGLTWSRDGGGSTLQAATSTVMAIQWGSNWNVQRTQVAGTAGANGADSTGAYVSSPISSVIRANTWVWGTGFTNDSGIGDNGEGVLITLGDGVSQSASETQVSVGIEYSRAMDFEVYALEHAGLAVDYNFKPDGDQLEVTYDQATTTAYGNRMALITNGSNGTGAAFPRPIWSARYLDNETIRAERRRWDQNWPAWIQGINFSGIFVPPEDPAVPAGTAPSLVTAADDYSLLPGQSLTATISVQVTDALLPQFISNTASVTIGDNPNPIEASALTEVRTLGNPEFTDVDGNELTSSPEYNLDGSPGSEPVYIKVVDPDRNTDPNLIESIIVTVTNPLTGDTVTLILYETGINTGEFANDMDGNRLIVPLVPCADPELDCCSDTGDPVTGCDDGDGGSTTPPSAADSLYIEPGTTPDLSLNYADPADSARDNDSAVAAVATQVVLSDFGSFVSWGRSVVYWETASEVGTVAFNLLRLNKTTGGYEQVNYRPIPSLRGQQQGGVYRLVDRQLDPGSTGTYQLEEIERSGKKNLYGPFTVTSGDVPTKILALSDNYRQIQRGAHPRNAEPGLEPPGKTSDTTRTTRPGRGWRAAREHDALKISITEEGFYFLGSEEIAVLFGMEERIVTRAIGRGKMNLSRNGDSVPYLPAPDQSGLFFYGAPADSIYTDTATYWLRPGTGLTMQAQAPVGDVTGSGTVGLEDAIAALKVVSGMRPAGVRPDYLVSGTDVNDNNRVDLAEALHALKAQSGSPDPVPSGVAVPGKDTSSFRAMQHFEENWEAFTDAYKDPNADYWMWNYMDAGWAPWDFLDNESLGTEYILEGWSGEGTLDLTIKLLGGNNTPAAIDHHVLVSLNGYQIGEAWWGGAKPYSIEIKDINPAAVEFLNNGYDILTIQALLEPDVDYGLVALDSITFHYQRTASVAENKLSLRSDEQGDMTVSGFTSSDIQVLDISAADQPRIIQTTIVDDAAGGYQVSFSPAAADTPYYAVVPDTAMVPDQVVPVEDSDLRAAENSYDYLVITPAAFADEAQVLVDYRISQGLSGRLVILEEIVDGFNHGLPGPLAINAFLKYAWQNWQQPPRYVALAGNGTYDYKDYFGAGDNHVPALMMGTPNGLFTSDQLLADVVGDDGVPDLAIGRLSAISAEELSALINQIKIFESGSGDWQQQAMILAGSPEHPGETNDFKTDSLSVASLLPESFTRNFIFQDDDADYQDVIDRLNEGVLFMNYIGHGGWDRLAGNALLSYSKYPFPWLRNDLPALTNADERPVLTALTCIVGNYAKPGFDYLGEALVKAPNGGTIAVWAPSGLSINEKAVWLNKEFLLQMAAHAGGDAVLGDLILKALQNYNAHYRDRMLVGLYNLLGDPALVIPIPE